ncbi:MAG: transcription antitermination factor NusB [Patescibacteria group bacterium]
MANRHLSRSIVLQSLFEWDFMGRADKDLVNVIKRNAEEFAPGMSDFSFMKNLGETVLKKRNEIDKIIEKAAPDWPLDRISTIDRNVLRIGLYELLFADRKEVPAKVAINEAIELAKTYGGENSGKFVNGVLGAVYKEIGEPGKDEVSKKKKIPNVPYENMPIQKLGGAVVYAKHKGEIYLAFVHDIFGHWTLSKGKIEKDKKIEDGTKSKIKEEIGLDIAIEKELSMNEYIANDPENGKIRKQVMYFLAKSPYGELHLGESGGLDDAKWFKLKEVIELNLYDDILPIVTKAVDILLKK